MPIEVYLAEGPNVQGLPEGRNPLYVGYSRREQDLIWHVIEGRKIGTPRSYRFHIGIGIQEGPLEEAEIIRFEHTRERTTVDFRFHGSNGQLNISNTSNVGRFSYENIDEKVDTVYNFFGDGKTDMRPSGCEEYYQD